MTYTNRDSAPRATTGAPGECDICGKPDATIVEFSYPHRVICETCVRAASAALKNAKAHEVTPFKGPYTA